MAVDKPAMDTPELLKLDPKTALTVIAGYYNDVSIEPDYVDITPPTVVNGRRTQVLFTPNPYYQGNSGLGRDYIGEYDLTYNRLDYGVYFQDEDIEIEMDLPTDTRTVAQVLGEMKNITFTNDDVEMIIVPTDASEATLSATSRSLRWIGQMTVKIRTVPHLIDVIPSALLNGFYMFDYTISIDDALMDNSVLNGFDQFVPQPYLTFVIEDPALGDVPALVLGHTPIGSYFPETVMASHWVVDDGIPAIVADTALTEEEMLRNAINTLSVVELNPGDYSIRYVQRDVSYGRNTQVRIQGEGTSNLQGTVDLHYNRIGMDVLWPNGLVDVNLSSDSTEAQVRAALLNQHNVNFDPATIVAEDQGGGIWTFTALPESLGYTGTATVQAYEFWDYTPRTRGFWRVPETPYIVYDQSLATSWGPLDTDLPLAETHGRWTAKINAQSTIDFYRGNTFAFTVLLSPFAAKHCDFAFTQTGRFSLVYEVEGQMYLVTGHSDDYTSVSLGSGLRPFINRLTWDIARTTQDIYIFYVRDNSIYYRRQSDNYQVEVSLGITNVLTVLSTNHDALFRLTVHYLTADGEIKNFSTEGGLAGVNNVPEFIGSSYGQDFTHLT